VSPALPAPSLFTGLLAARRSAVCLALIGSLGVLSACEDPAGGKAEVDTAGVTADDPDDDNDGFPASEDCNDGDPATNPGGVELCDGIDNNCDGQIDEGVTLEFFPDEDGDGFGDDAADPVEACAASEGLVSSTGDCDDTDPAVHPDAAEVCNEVDDDCDGTADEDVGDVFYRDADGDTFGDPDAMVLACELPADHVENADDCDDLDADNYPGAPEVCDERDNDCDGETDEGVTTTFFRDADGDGYGDLALTTEACVLPSGYATLSGDCDDSNSLQSPGLSEQCNGYDDNCDGFVDEPTATDAATWYADADADGYGDAATSQLACEAPSGFVADATDCDDAATAVNPGATEVCNSIDDDCDALVDDDDTSITGQPTWYLDFDSDGYGGTAFTSVSCAAPSGYVSDNTDCDDGESTVNPGATEVCNGGVDDDCNGSADDSDTGLDLSTRTDWYADSDSDGYGDASVQTTACAAPSNTVTDNTDCDDTTSAVNPGETEICNGGIDDDCNGVADDSDSALDLSTRTDWHADSDGDGFGDPGISTTSCAAPSNTVTDNSDCDDSNSAVNPSETEICNGGIDDDCNGVADDSDSALDLSTRTTWYGDADSDGYGDPTVATTACAAPANTVTDGSDCNDLVASINPGETEVCNSIDDDCDGDTDDADSSLDLSTASTWYDDDDGDGYGDLSASTQACSQPSGTVSDDTDCDDGDNQSYPGATEQCDGTDNDCDGTADNGAIGTSSTCAATSCEDVLIDDPTATSGAYYLDPEGTGAYLNYCDMSTDGGGWTLIFSCSAPDTTYGSGFAGWWSNGSTTTLDSTSDRGKSKAYDEVDFTEIMMTATYPNTSRNIASTGAVRDDMHDLVGSRITTCSGLTGSARYRYTSSRSGSYFQNSYLAVVSCDTDGSSLETTSAGNYDAAIFSSNMSHGDHNYAEGTIGAEYTCGGSSRGYGAQSSNILGVWVR
jgi:hypothetical protein